MRKPGSKYPCTVLLKACVTSNQSLNLSESLVSSKWENRMLGGGCFQEVLGKSWTLSQFPKREVPQNIHTPAVRKADCLGQIPPGPPSFWS